MDMDMDSRTWTCDMDMDPRHSTLHDRRQEKTPRGVLLSLHHSASPSPSPTSMAAEPLRLYRSMLRAGKSFQSYNFRDYAMRSVKIRFRENAGLKDAHEIRTALYEGRQGLELIKRQATISHLFPQSQHCMDGATEYVPEGSRFPGDPKA